MCPIYLKLHCICVLCVYSALLIETLEVRSVSYAVKFATNRKQGPHISFTRVIKGNGYTCYYEQEQL